MPSPSSLARRLSWLWGVWGTLLAVPALMVLKAVCDRIEDLKPVGELLGD